MYDSKYSRLSDDELISVGHHSEDYRIRRLAGIADRARVELVRLRKELQELNDTDSVYEARAGLSELADRKSWEGTS